VKIPDPQHQAARVMRRPNDYMTPFTFRQTLQAHALLYGNGYAYIQRDASSRARWNCAAVGDVAVWPVRVNGVLWYVADRRPHEGASGATRPGS
jgi:phage portal protein BeeE